MGKDAVTLTARSRAFAAVIAIALAAGAPVAARQAPAADVEVDSATAPVVFDGAVLFRVRGVSSLTAEARARGIQDRLEAVASDPAIDASSLRAVPGDGVTRIMAGGTVLMGVLDADASLEQVPRDDLAAVHLSRVRQALVSYRAARSPSALRRDATRALIATAVFALALATTVLCRRWADRLLERRLHARIHTVGIQSFELMRADRIWNALRRGVLALQTIVILTAALLYLGFVLAQFPWTRGLSGDMAALALRPLRVMGAGVLASIPGLVFLAVLFFLVRVGLRVIRLFFDAVANRRVTLESFDAEWAQPTYKIIRVAVIAFGLVVAYPYIPGSDSAAFRGVSLFIGIVFSLGSSSAIANIVAGYMMTYRRAFKVGDRIKVGNAMGDVIETRLQVTHLRSVKNEEIIVPNSQILTGDVVNYSSLARAGGLILHTDVGIGYETPWRQVEAMLLLAASRTPGLLREPGPFVLERALGDFAVTYELNAYSKDAAAMYEQYAELHRHILDVFNEYGVQIMTPAYVRDPDQPKLVPPADWYAAPAAGSERLRAPETRGAS